MKSTFFLSITLFSIIFLQATSPICAWTQVNCCTQQTYGPSHWVVAQIPVKSNANNLPTGVSPSQFVSAMQSAINTWNSAGANISFTYSGGIGTESCSPSGFIDCSDPASPCKPTFVDNVGFSTALKLFRFPAVTPGSWLEIETTLGQEFDTCEHNSGKTLAYTVALNNQAPFSTNPTSIQYDLESVILHELGHVLGLGHSVVSGAVMESGIQAGAIKRTLSPDDIAGIKGIYPTSSPGGSAIPTLSEWAIVMFSVLLLCLMTIYTIRSRRFRKSGVV